MVTEKCFLVFRWDLGEADLLVVPWILLLGLFDTWRSEFTLLSSSHQEPLTVAVTF